MQFKLNNSVQVTSTALKPSQRLCIEQFLSRFPVLPRIAFIPHALQLSRKLSSFFLRDLAKLKTYGFELLAA